MESKKLFRYGVIRFVLFAAVLAVFNGANLSYAKKARVGSGQIGYKDGYYYFYTTDGELYRKKSDSFLYKDTYSGYYEEGHQQASEGLPGCGGRDHTHSRVFTKEFYEDICNMLGKDAHYNEANYVDLPDFKYHWTQHYPFPQGVDSPDVPCTDEVEKLGERGTDLAQKDVRASMGNIEFDTEAEGVEHVADFDISELEKPSGDYDPAADSFDSRSVKWVNPDIDFPDSSIYVPMEGNYLSDDAPDGFIYVEDSLNVPFTQEQLSDLMVDYFDDNDMKFNSVETTGDVDAGGNLSAGGNLNVDGNSTFNGTSDFKQDVTMDQNLDVKGDTNLEGKLDVQGDTHLHQDLQVDGDTNLNGNLTVEGDSTFNGTAEFKQDVTMDQNLDVKGDTNLEGKLDVQGDTHLHQDLQVDGDTNMNGNLTVQGDSHVGGDFIVDGHASFPGGLTVPDGYIGPGSKDAVNGGQMYQMERRLTSDINKAGANAAALAGLHPLDYDPAAPDSFNAAVGNYRGETALAVGFSHYFSEDTMLNAGVTFQDEPMVNLGLSLRLGREKSTPSLRMTQKKRLNLAEEEIHRMRDSMKKRLEEKDDQITLLNMRLLMVEDEMNELHGDKLLTANEFEAKKRAEEMKLAAKGVSRDQNVSDKSVGVAVAKGGEEDAKGKELIQEVEKMLSSLKNRTEPDKRVAENSTPNEKPVQKSKPESRKRAKEKKNSKPVKPIAVSANVSSEKPRAAVEPAREQTLDEKFQAVLASKTSGSEDEKDAVQKKFLALYDTKNKDKNTVNAISAVKNSKKNELRRKPLSAEKKNLAEPDKRTAQTGSEKKLLTANEAAKQSMKERRDYDRAHKPFPYDPLTDYSDRRKDTNKAMRAK